MSENKLAVTALATAQNEAHSPSSLYSHNTGAGAHTSPTAPEEDKSSSSSSSSSSSETRTEPQHTPTVEPLVVEESAQQQPQLSRRRKIAWKCGMCGYHVLAMDQEGHPLPFSVSSFGEALPMGCPRCLLNHMKWEQAIPFNEHGDHKNIRSTLSNNYFRTSEQVMDSDESATHTQPPPTQPPTGAFAEKGVELPDVLRQIGRYTYKDGVPIPIAEKAPRRRDRMAYYCALCNRQLLRMDPYGELVPMVQDKDGAAHGVTTVALGHPIDTAKTRMQALGPRSAHSFLVTMYRMARAEGVRSLYRGMTPPLVMSATKRSLQFAVWDVFRHPEKVHSSSSFFSQCATWVSESPFRAGAFAGALGTIIGCPIHVIKIRTQFSTRNITRNAWTCAKDIYRSEGLPGYYRGFHYHVLKDTLFAGCYLGMYETIQLWLATPRHSNSDSATAITIGDSSVRLDSQVTFLAGCISSMLTWTLFYPFDTIKTIVQARNIGTRQVIDIFWHDKTIIYRGLGASIVRSGPVSGAAMVSYEFVKKRIDNWRQRDIGNTYMRST